MRMKTFTLLTVALAVLSSVALGQDVRGPSLSGAVLTVTNTVGTVLNGGAAVAVTAGTTVVTAARADCSAPVFASCNFLYVPAAGGAVLTTDVLGTALAAGNVLLAFVETNGAVITGLRTANQSGTIQTNALGTPTSFVAAPVPSVAAAVAVGSALLPFNSVYLGTAATNNIRIQPTATAAARVVRLADQGAAGAIAVADPTDITKVLNVNLAGQTGGATLTLAPTLAVNRTITLPDPGGAGTLAFTNPTTAQTLANTTIAQTSAAAYNSFTTFPTQVGMGYTDTADVAGRQWFSSIYIPTSVTLTGACVKQGTVPATDLFIVALWNSLGATVATSNLAGALFGATAAAELYECQAFTAPVAVTGPARYFVGIQGNGNTANEFYTYAAATAPAGYATGITAPGVFGTITAIVPTTAFTANQGPIMSVY